jgi:hypothetical protein
MDTSPPHPSRDCRAWPTSVVNDFLLRISIVRLPPAPRLRRTWQLRWSRRKNPSRISDLGELSRVVDAPPVFSWSPPRFVKTLKMLTTEPSFTTLLGVAHSERLSTLKSNLLSINFDLRVISGPHHLIRGCESTRQPPAISAKTSAPAGPEKRQSIPSVTFISCCGSCSFHDSFD